MLNLGWALGVGASILLGPIVYVLARLADAVAPRAVPVPVVVRVADRGPRR
jgi:hypothetical protein